jgi:hypothetical protein
MTSIGLKLRPTDKTFCLLPQGARRRVQKNSCQGEKAFSGFRSGKQLGFPLRTVNRTNESKQQGNSSENALSEIFKFDFWLLTLNSKDRLTKKEIIYVILD